MLVTQSRIEEGWREGRTDGWRDGWRDGGRYSENKGVSFDPDLFNRDKREEYNSITCHKVQSIGAFQLQVVKLWTCVSTFGRKALFYMRAHVLFRTIPRRSVILYTSAVYCCPGLLLKAILPNLDVIFKTYLDFK